MKGKVRLLFFWIGKDKVGGGTISFLKAPGETEHSGSEGVEVLFGSIPERVPGGINRWGYAREWACWEATPTGSRRLNHTAFRGFMRHSGEESLAEVRNSHSEEISRKLYWYDATESRVSRHKASAELRVFSLDQDFDFRRPEIVQLSYARTGLTRPARETRESDNKGVYEEPQGFLTAVRETLREISTAFAKDQRRWSKLRPALTYVHNTKPYLLSVEDVRYHERFPVEKENGEKQWFASVAEVKFREKNPRAGSTHDFKIWFPLQGPLQGVPLRIEDMPRWWLRIELNLVPEAGAGDLLQSR